MNNKQRILGVLNYHKIDVFPVVHFGYWPETLQKWYQQGYLTRSEVYGWADGNKCDVAIAKKLGFDFNWQTLFISNCGLFPSFESVVIEQFEDGSYKKLGSDGVVVLEKPGMASVPCEIDHLLKDRKSWEKYYKPRLQFSNDRVQIKVIDSLRASISDNPIGLHLGSLIGVVRNWLGVEAINYLSIDDEKLLTEIIETLADVSFKCVQSLLSFGINFDYAHFWEDICCKNGPLISSKIVAEKTGPLYKKITDLVRQHGIEIISLDCDGNIDALLPIWFENGVNTMFPIEVGTWNASIKPWREMYGKELRGVGGMNKAVFAKDYSAIDAEIERLKPLVALGGYIPCPDHRIPPDSKWDNVCYYCEKIRNVLS
ncbi:MAG: hypothetical protein A2Y10_17390 [Planctomycetes bacterium GWF2_41_51]|nr:MAG: hypothetical protein A2Y10_17390 [Planctomycetes bacterium GWF2_41_51]HBG28001.1 hypothetical protein [Phycisphaerales bacterium]